MKKFCPKCGKIITEGKFCENCRVIKLEIKPINIKLCPSKRYFYRNKWTKFEDLKKLTKKLVEESTKQKIKIIKGLEQYEEILLQQGMQKDLPVQIEYKKEKFEIPINTEITLSPQVAKVDSEYYEGILQIRNSTPEVKAYIQKYISKDPERYMINKIQEKENYLDIYFQKKKVIEHIALKIQRNYGGIMHTNAQLFSYNKQKSKDIYRINTLLTLPKFAKKDVIIHDNKPLQITGTKNIITATNLKTGKKYTFKPTQQELDEINPVKKYKTRVTKIYPQLEIMDPQTYQSIPIKYNLDATIEFKPGQKITVIRFKNLYYLIE
ncbi:hypothetical protein K9L97_03395 [Candidatus Woesearchaeota archaeon]|nr:hypothetical protein [Candidatus Woesearchaeota archaeon]